MPDMGGIDVLKNILYFEKKKTGQNYSDTTFMIKYKSSIRICHVSMRHFNISNILTL